MAERFHGPNYRTVKFSNGCSAELVSEWLRICKELSPSEARTQVIAFLAQTLKNAPGDCSFNFTPPPEALQDQGNLRCFAEVLVQFIDELAAEHVEYKVGTCQLDREQQLSWLARMLDLLEIVNDGFASDQSRITAGTLPLTAQEEADCQLERLRWKRIHYLKYHPAKETQTILAIIEQMLHIALTAPQPNRAAISALYSDSADILVSVDDYFCALQALGSAIEYEQDEDMKQSLREYAESLRGRS